MADKKRSSRGFTLLIAVLLVLLIGAIALFVYGSMTHAIPRPQLPGKGVFALRTIYPHG